MRAAAVERTLRSRPEERAKMVSDGIATTETLRAPRVKGRRMQHIHLCLLPSAGAARVFNQFGFGR
jgi:hypothetical protein